MSSDEINGTSNAGAVRDWHVDPDRAAFVPRKLRVICVGAGFSGLILAYKVMHEWNCGDYLDLTIYEKNSEVGGTWLENIYPGVGWYAFARFLSAPLPSYGLLGVDAHHISRVTVIFPLVSFSPSVLAFQLDEASSHPDKDSYILPFEPNPNWSKFYVSGPEIQKYILDTTEKYSLRDKITFDTNIVKSHWDEDQGKWKVELEQNGARIHDEADILINASGILKLVVIVPGR